MVGIVIVAHGILPDEFIRVTGMITKARMERVAGVSINPDDKNKVLSNRIQKAIDGVNDGDGVIVFTDMFGGTPSNIALSFMEEEKVEIIFGLNLPMLLFAATRREGVSLSELILSLQQAGRESISLASEILRGKND